jgi:hypothetical protein
MSGLSAEETEARQAVLVALNKRRPLDLMEILYGVHWTMPLPDRWREFPRLIDRLFELKADGLVAMGRIGSSDVVFSLTDAGRAAADAGRPA